MTASRRTFHLSRGYKSYRVTTRSLYRIKKYSIFYKNIKKNITYRKMDVTFVTVRNKIVKVRFYAGCTGYKPIVTSRN